MMIIKVFHLLHISTEIWIKKSFFWGCTFQINQQSRPAKIVTFFLLKLHNTASENNEQTIVKSYNLYICVLNLKVLYIIL